MTSILLRPVNESDLRTLFEFQLDPEATAMAAFPSRDHDAFMTHSAKIMGAESVVYHVILADGQLAGSLVSWEMDGNREVGYWLGREFWGMGIATEALGQFLGVVRIRPLFARVAKHNIGSQKVLEKCGFKVIGDEKFMNRVNEEVDGIVMRLD